jgi:feruloyl esterase
VKPLNAGEIIKQWTNVHGLPPLPNRDETVDGYPRRVWTNDAGEDVIEEYLITGMAHGTPLATGDGDNQYGVAGPFLLEAGISSSYRIAQFWGLTKDASSRQQPRPTTQSKPQELARVSPTNPDVGDVIARALRAAGLMK